MRRPRPGRKLRVPAPRWEVIGRRMLVLATGLLAALPVISFVGKFRDEFEYHIHQKRCKIKGSCHAQNNH